ncbi:MULTISPECIES: TraV family lipoprotein [Sphingomonas]|jgi:conjugal transfer pilus assembly protein TraV|uniref:Conjugal transfer protein TraV n=1 Tax=Sphingomonas turrisvirgatae TaxID=1888892 RepID=A0A1E3LYC7_9SPHN|nr:TraV family lipoprotein [Sphingomonas turrisvirgatae]ODP38796.1 conjugal transfer protein TraV [Sphingomonas turrisvirgatae]
MRNAPVRACARATLLAATMLWLPGCATLGSVMSPYSEKFSCKNDDHGQCVHPEQAYADAVAGVISKSDPRVTNDRTILRDQVGADMKPRRGRAPATAYGSYRDSLYAEMKGLLEAPVTPMLKPARTVRTLILPYADRQRPDRLYMPRYIYSILDKPAWVVGGTLVSAPSRAAQAPVLGQLQETPADAAERPAPELRR